jgi:hypothetical protein
MRMRMLQEQVFRLDQNPNGRGLRCDSDGLFLGCDALLERDEQGNFDPRPDGELRKILGGALGDESNWESRLRSVKLVSNALNKGDLARAMMTAVLMRLPEPGYRVRIAEIDGLFSKVGFNPDEPRDNRGRWTIGRFWQALGSTLSHEIKSALSGIGREQIRESNSNLAMAVDQEHAIASVLRDYAKYRAQPWLDADGHPMQVPFNNFGDSLSNQAALESQALFEPKTPLTRPGTNADWIDRLITLVSVAGMVGGTGSKLAPAAETLDAAAIPVAASGTLIGKSGFRSITEFTDAVTSQYQALYDQGYILAVDRAKQGLIANTPVVVGNETDSFARYGLKDWLANTEGIDEGPGQIIQVNRRLYDPLGSGSYRLPDVYIPASQTILDGSVQFKTNSMGQILDYNSFSGGAKVIIVRPSAVPPGSASGSYGIVY